MPDALRDSVAAEAEAILLSVVHTVYQHDTYVDVVAGTYGMDCSGYVGYVFQRIAPRHYQTIPFDSAAGRPLEIDFYDLFSELPVERATGGGPYSPSPGPPELSLPDLTGGTEQATCDHS
jgi:hypothetical protein